VVKLCRAEALLRLASDKSREVNLDVDYAPGRLTVRASESQLARAVGNLVHNAVESIANHGEVLVKTRRERVLAPLARYETIPEGHYVVLIVSDNGCGIDPQDLGRVFEPFFTKKRTGESTGTGLGLAIVHGVVKEHDGFIDVTSTLGEGTTFSLYLPLAEAVTQERPALAEAPRSEAKILLVDDDPIQLRTCHRILTHLGYAVETMDSGSGAYETFSHAPTGKSPYGLVILDMLLGERLDGLQVFEQIQQLFPDQKAILASGHAPNERAELAVQKGLTWLSKPYSMEALTKAVKHVLDNPKES
jgi:CheY-like chemotaxis protein